jgi:beta-lactamase regulating signal transducer with metallopeptidase domain
MNITDAMGWTLIHFLWQGAVIALAFAFVTARLRRASANVRYMLAALTLLAMAAAPAATVAWLASEPQAPNLTGAVPLAPAQAVLEAGAAAPMPQLARQLSDFFPAVITLWLIGVGIMSVWSALAWFGTVRWRRIGTQPAAGEWCARLNSIALSMGIRRKVQLLESRLVHVPSVLGVVRPLVLLPAGALLNLPVSHVEALLAHELAHVRRHDYFVNILQTLVETLLFYHPAVWWVSHRMRIEREHACDDLAVAACGDVLVYARALTGLEEMRQATPGLAMAANGGSLIARIRRLTAKHEAETPAKVAWMLVAIAVLAGMTLSARGGLAGREFVPAPTNLEAPDPEPEPEPQQAPVARTAPAPRAPQQPPAQKVIVKPAPTSEPVRYVKGSGLLAALTAAGYRDLSIDEIIDLKNQGITGDYLMEMSSSSFGRLTPKQLVELRNNSVDPRYLRAAGESHIRELDTRGVVEMRQHGVEPDLMREIHALGFGPYSARESVEMAQHGVRPDIFRGLKEAGFTQIGPKEAIELQNNGVRASHLQEARRYGSQLTIKQIVRLKQAGVL